MANLLQMKYFLLVAEERSVSHAAKRLYISQQTLSAHISQLEKDMGTILFERTRPLTLTPAGERFLSSAREMLAIDAQLRHDLQDILNPEKTVLRIGVAHAYGRALLPTLLKEYYSLCPDAIIQIHELQYEQMDEAFADSKIDLAISRPMPSQESMNYVLLKERDIFFLYAPRESLENLYGKNEAKRIARMLKQQASLELVKDCPFILPRSGTVRSAVFNMFVDAQINPVLHIETDTLETAISLCSAGLGITISPELLLKTYAKIGNDEDICPFFPLEKPSEAHAIRICYPKKSYVTHAMQLFIYAAQQTHIE